MSNIEAGQIDPSRIDPNEVLRLDGSVQQLQLGGPGNVESAVDIPPDMLGSLGTVDLGEGRSGDVMARLDMGATTNLAIVDTRPGEPFVDGLPPDDRYALVRVSGTSQDIKPIIQPDGSRYMAFLGEPDTTHFFGREPEKASLDIKELAAVHDRAVSRKHIGFAINEDGGLRLMDVSKYGTKVTIKTAGEAKQALPEVVQPDRQEAEEIGEVAVEEVVNVEPVVAEVQQAGKASESAAEGLELPTPVDTPAIVGNKEEVEPDPASDGKPGSDKQREEQAPQDKELLKQQAMRELREEWGMPEDFTEQQAVERLMAEHNELELMMKQLKQFRQTGHNAAKAIYDTLQGRGIVYLGNRTKDDVDRFLFETSMRIDGYQAQDTANLLPGKLRGKIMQHQNDLRQLRSAWQQATDGFRRGRPSLEQGSANMAAGYLSRSVPELERALVNVDKQIKQQIEHITGRPFGAKEVEEIREDVIYRNPEWAKRAEKLKDVSTDDPKLEQFVQDIEAAIQIETGMVDDPNSPRKWFGYRILTNGDKGRQDSIASNRQTATTSSQRAVAEIAADIMRGSFNYDRAKYDPIELSQDGKEILLGQHRAAALAMIFGPDRWIEEGLKRGMRIERRK